MSTFTKTANGKVLFTVSGENYGFDPSLNVLPHPSSEDLIVLADRPSVSMGTGGAFMFNWNDVTSPSESTRADLIQNLTENFFFRVTPGGGFSNEKSLIFDGSNDYVLIGNVSELSFERTDTFSIAVWFKTSANGPIMMLASKREQYGNRRGWEARFRTDNDKWIFIFSSVDGSSEINVSWDQASDEFNDGNWHLMVWTYDGSSAGSGFTLYLDNASKPLTVNDDTLTTTTVTTQGAQLSGKYGTGFPFNGNLDECSVWDKELSAAEVSEIWHSGAPTNLAIHSASANLTGWWRCGDDDIFPVIQDNSISGNDGTMTNMDAGDIVEDVP